MGLEGRPVIVLGMFRSGTSSVSAALAKLGFFFGEDEEFFPTDEFNQTGYWELRDVMAVNRQCLAALHMSYHRVERFPKDWQELPGLVHAQEKVASVLEKHFSGRAQWGWKEPMTSVLVPLYREVLAKKDLTPHYAICVRNPLDVAASERGREPLMGVQAYGLWLSYTLGPVIETIGQSRSLVVYEEFLKDPRLALGHIAEGAAVTPSESRWKEAVDLIQADLRHHHFTHYELGAWPELLGNTYDLCVRAGKDQAGFASGAYDGDFQELWREFCKLKEMLRQSDLENGTITLSWQEGGAIVKSSSRYVPTSNWQSVRAKVTAVPGATVRAELYQAPSQVWVRKAVWHTASGPVPVQMQAGSTGFVEEREGMPCVSVFGPDPLLMRAPDVSGAYELEFEFLLESDFNVAARILTKVRGMRS